MSKKPRLNPPSTPSTLFKPFKQPLKLPTSNPSSPTHSHTPVNTSSNPRPPHTHSSYISLTKRLSALRSDLSTAQQALALVSADNTTSADLEREIDTWRQASRDAAEVVFESSRRRVEAEGGLGGMLQRQQQEKNGWEDEREGRGKGEGGGKGGSEEDDEDIPRSLTMAMMLRSMNIDVDLLGWDEENERWKD